MRLYPATATTAATSRSPDVCSQYPRCGHGHGHDEDSHHQADDTPQLRPESNATDATTANGYSLQVANDARAVGAAMTATGERL